DHESHFYAALEQQLNLSLAFINALFKFPLIPASSSTELELLEKMWTCIRDILLRCLPEVQRVMSEAWGGVLWRLKPEAKERAGREVQDAIAWCVVYACKLFTALMHHVRNTENFASVGDVLVDKFISLAQGTTPFSEDDLETLRRMMDLISIAAAVRNGSRLTQKHATTLLAAFPSILNISLATPSPQMQAALLRLTTALLNASPEANPAFWMGKGREVLDTVWNTGSETLGWAGWRAIGVPVHLQMLSKIISAKDSGEELQRKTKLGTGDGDVVWRNCVESWGVKKLREMAGSVSALSWGSALLAPANPSTSAPSGPSHPWFVDTCMWALAQRPATEWENLDLARWCCLAGEEVPLEVQGVRERVLRIGRVKTVVKDKQRETDVGPDLCTQLKMNLPGPLWSPAAGVLAQMAQQFGDEIWRIIFEELQTLYSSLPPTNNVRLEQMDEDEEQGGEDKDPWEEERTWRDPSAHKLRGVVGKWLNTQHRTGELVESSRTRV
ncbi:hypothetical protein B0H14DRAFT_2611270, partial [Mycena olivaceomarginata]